MKIFIQKYKISILIVLTASILTFLTLVPKLKHENQIVIANIAYGNLKDLEGLNLKYDYEIKSLFESISLSLHSEYTSLRLISVSNFDDFVYPFAASFSTQYIKVLLASGEYPENNNEVILQNGLSSFYKIGDTIKLNMGDIYGDTSSENNVKVLDSLDGYKKGSLRYENESNLKEYKIVGFYTWESDEYVEKLVNGEITFLNNENGWSFFESLVFTKNEKNYFMHEKVNAILTYKSFNKNTENNKDYKIISTAFRDYYECNKDYMKDYCINGIGFSLTEYDPSEYDNLN